MKTSQSISKIAGALLNVQKEVKAVTKGIAHGHFKGRFYADINSMLAEVKPILTKHGLVLLQPHRTVSSTTGEQLVVETVVLHAESGEFISGETTVTVSKQNDPQALGSAITYSRRYGLQSTLGLEAEDDDGEAAMGRGTVAHTPTVSPAQPQLETKKSGGFKAFKAAPQAESSDFEGL